MTDAGHVLTPPVPAPEGRAPGSRGMRGTDEPGGSMDVEEAIRARFMKEYARKDFPGITARELCAGTPAARTACDSSLGSTDEVRGEIEDDPAGGIAGALEKVSAGNCPDMDAGLCMDETEGDIKRNRTAVHVFPVRRPDLRPIRKWKDAIRHSFSKRYPDGNRAKNDDAVAETAASSMPGSCAYRMEHPDTGGIGDAGPQISAVPDSPGSCMQVRTLLTIARCSPGEVPPVMALAAEKAGRAMTGVFFWQASGSMVSTPVRDVRRRISRLAWITAMGSGHPAPSGTGRKASGSRYPRT